MSEGYCTVRTSFSLGLSSAFSAKPHFSMEDLATNKACDGVNGQSKTDESPADHSVDSCCGSWLQNIKLGVPAAYKNETVQFLKLAGPVVRLCSDVIRV